MKSTASPGIHLGETELELKLFEFQHAVVCYVEAFYRFIESELGRVTGDTNLSAQDCIILQAIRLGERPKSIPELQHFTNRSDIANMQYSVKKLLKAGLIRKANGAKGRGTAYCVSDLGRRVTGEYAKLRRAFLSSLPIAPAKLMGDAEVATKLLILLTGHYDQATRVSAARAAAR